MHIKLTLPSRQRRVKCGEQRPGCLQCIKCGRECPGYQKPRVWLFEPLQYGDYTQDHELPGPSLAPSLSPFQDSQTGRVLQYYFECSEAPISRFFALAMTPLFQDRSRAGNPDKISSIFWTVTFPRLVCAEPVIAKCLIVLVTSHEKVHSSTGSFEMEPECLQKFVEAITLLRTEWNSMSVDCILIASVVLAIAELSFGPSPGGLAHLYAGNKIIQQRRSHPEDYAHHRSSPEIEGIRDSIELLYEAFFTRLDLESSTTTSREEETAELATAPTCSLPLVFSNTRQALEELEPITTAAMTSLKGFAAGIDPRTRINIRYCAENWLRAFQELEARLDSTTDPEFLKACLIIRIEGLTALILSSLPSSELNYNQHKAEFLQIAEFAEEFLKIGGGMTQSVKAHLIHGIGPVNPLFFAATKCRVPVIRQRLLKALRRLKVVEGLWTSCAAYQIAEQISDLEAKLEGADQKPTDGRVSNSITLESVTFNSPHANLLDIPSRKRRRRQGHLEYNGAHTSLPPPRVPQSCRADNPLFNTMSNMSTGPSEYWRIRCRPRVCQGH